MTARALFAAVCVCGTILPASAQWYWPPRFSASVRCGDVVGAADLTLSGTWPDFCSPGSMRVSRVGDAITLTLVHDFPEGSICLPALRDYSFTSTIILADGSYRVFASLESRAVPPLGPTPVGSLTIRCLPFCPADFNEDGGVDGADVEGFFTAWEAADPLADVNNDGGIDGADVEVFFAYWSAGGC